MELKLSTKPAIAKLARCKGWVIPVLIALCVLTAAWVSMAAWQAPPLGRAGTHTQTPELAAARRLPLRVQPTLSLPGSLNETQIQKAIDRLTLDRPSGLSEVLHVLRLFGPDACFSDKATSKAAELLPTVLDYEKSLAYFHGQPTLIDTREGIRCRTVVRRDAKWQRERQAHADQLLAVLAELGVPSVHPVTTAGGSRTVQQLLNDTIANFDPNQVEIEWSALAFALYLPPRTSWTDKYGTTYTFDDLAGELMSRQFGGQIACAGTHLLYSLVIMLRVDEQEPILSPSTRAKLREYLGNVAAGLTRVQSSEGSWGVDWHERVASRSLRNENPHEPGPAEVLASGHHLEWLMLLPSDLLPPRDIFLRSARWLEVRLRTAPQAALRENYCPYSHAARVLWLLAGHTDPNPKTQKQHISDQRLTGRG